MTSLGLLRGCVALALTVGIATSGSSPALADDVKIKLQTHFNPTLSVIGEASKNFVDTLERISGGEIDVSFYEAGKLVPTFETFDAVKNGTLDAAYGWSGYIMGKLPSMTVFAAIPFGPSTEEYIAWMYQGDGQKLFQEIYAKHNVHGMLCGMIGPEAAGWYRKEIKTVDDFKGLKLRYAGLGGKVLQKLGASVTVLAAGDIFPNLEKGVIDGTEFSMPSIDKNLGFYKVANHYYFPGWHQPASTGELIINERLWNKLSEQQKAWIETACMANVTWEIARGAAEQAAAMEFYRNEGVQIHTFSPDVMQVLQQTTKEVMAEEAAADPDFGRVYENLMGFLEKTRGWSDVAFIK